jgi:hypothetical protein
MSKHDSNKTTAFVLEVGKRAVLALSAASIGQARDFCAQDWFVEELGSYRSGGRAIWDGAAELTIRCASPQEAAELDVALATECARGEYDGFIFAFLVALDAIPQ